MPLEEPLEESPLTSEEKNMAALSYLVGPLTGLVVFFREEDSFFVRFHALQSIIAFSILFLVAYVFSGGSSLVQIVAFSLLVLLPWAVAIGSALSGRLTKFPFIGDYAVKREYPKTLDLFPSVERAKEERKKEVRDLRKKMEEEGEENDGD